MHCPSSVERKNTPESIPHDGFISSCNSKSPNVRSVSRIPPFPEPGGSCSPASTPPSSAVQCPPVPCPIFFGLRCQPSSVLPSNSVIQPSLSAFPAACGLASAPQLAAEPSSSPTVNPNDAIMNRCRYQESITILQ